MKNYSRAMHFDFHTMPGIAGLLSAFDADSFAERLCENHVEFINFTARCNIGFSYYDTAIGTKYPGLERDVLAEVITACHKRGIGVAAYINGGLDHELALHEHGFCKRNKEGSIYLADPKSNFFRMMCFNTPYRDHLYAEIKELLAYDIDGLFVDCMLTKPCYCPACLEKMSALGISADDEAAVWKYQESLVFEVYREIKQMIYKDIYLYFNSNKSIPGIHTHAEVECLPSSKQWGSDFFYPASSFHRTHFKKRVYMTGRFQDNWGDFGGIKTLEAMQNDLYDAQTSAYDLSISDHLHPIVGLFDEVIDGVGKVFAEKMLYEPYTLGSEYVCDVGVVVDEDDYYSPELLRGVARMLCELKIPFDVYVESDDYFDKKLLIFPKRIDLDETHKERLVRFKENGGKILFCGSGLDVAKECNLDASVEMLGEDSHDNAYYVLDGSDMRWGMYKTSRLMKKRGGKEIAKYAPGLFNRIYDGKHAYFYRPQGEVSDMSAAVSDGDVAYICFDAFLSYATNFLKTTKTLVGKVISTLNEEPLIKCDGLPSTSIVSITQSPTAKVLHVKVTAPTIRNGRGIIEEHTFVPSARISVRGEYKAYVLPDKTPIDVTQNNGRTVIQTKDILGYRAFLLVDVEK